MPGWVLLAQQRDERIDVVEIDDTVAIQVAVEVRRDQIPGVVVEADSAVEMAGQNGRRRWLKSAYLYTMHLPATRC